MKNDLLANVINNDNAIFAFAYNYESGEYFGSKLLVRNLYRFCSSGISFVHDGMLNGFHLDSRCFLEQRGFGKTSKPTAIWAYASRMV